MSKKLNISVLVAARDEYIDQLKRILIPLIIQGFNSIYADALKLNEKKPLYKFQELLKEIPKWNQTILQEESKRIKRKCSYIMDIVTAIFVSNVKILASIRLKGNNENIKVKIPTSDIFIHSIYIESAQKIFYNPYLFYHINNNFRETENNKKLVIEIVNISIDETIRQMLPFDEILQEYLVNALNDNADKSSDSESSDSEVSDDSEDEYLNADDIANSDVDDTEDYNEDEIKNINTGGSGNDFIDDDDNSDKNSENDYSLPPHVPLEVSHTPHTLHTQYNNPVLQQPQVQQPQVLQPQVLQPQIQQQMNTNSEDNRHSFF
jgi:hypothetical protein